MTSHTRPALPGSASAVLVTIAITVSACGDTTRLDPKPAASVGPTAIGSVATPMPTTGQTGTAASPSPSSSGLGETPSIEWQRHVLPTGVLLSVTVDGDRFLAVGSIDGDSDSVATSDDGVAWRVLARSPFDGDLPWSITSAAGRLIVLARRPILEDGEAVGSQTAVWTSPDGAEWEPWVEPEGFRHPRAFARFRDRWLMQSVFEAGIETSVDGAAWTRVVEVEASEAAGFAAGPGGLVAGYTLDDPTSFLAAIVTTVDGEAWTETLLDDGEFAMVDTVSADDSIYVALGRARTGTTPFTGAAWWSTDGVDWQRATVPEAFSSAEWFSRHIRSTGDSFIAVVQLGVEGQLGLLWSSDGRAWVFVEPMPQMSLGEISLLVTGDRLLLYGSELDGSRAGVVWEGPAGPLGGTLDE